MRPGQRERDGARDGDHHASQHHGPGTESIGEPPGRRPGQAIAAATLRLVIRDGYERTSVDAIAAEAGVSKRTVYNHYGDKENLFLSVVQETYDAVQARFVDLADRALGDPGQGEGDLERSLLEFARDLALGIAQSPDRAALVRLVITEAPHFPSLLERWRTRKSITPLVAQYLARFATAGRLDITDPEEAAAHLLALTIGQLNNRTLFGAAPITDAEADRLVARAFLRAYRP